jgi:hypothetical protein
MNLNYLSPIFAYRKMRANLNELSKYKTYKKIIFELNEAGKLDQIGFKADSDANLYLGIDLNPELLLYSEGSQESVELKLISEKMNRYNDFLTKEGILDSITVEYERIKNDDFYGYVLQIGFNFSKYSKKDLRYSIAYLASLLVATASLGYLLVR